MKRRFALSAAACAATAAFVAPAFAHGGDDITAQTAWSAWRLTPGVVIPAALAGAIYIAGMIRRAAAAERQDWIRSGFFLAGLASIFLALQSPIDPIAERLFWVHQVQHLLLRMLGPMLIALAWPEAVFIAGLPVSFRRRVLSPVISNGGVRGVVFVLAHPVVATTTFIAALYVWEYPRFHNAALVNESIHDLMHATMLIAGVIFWQRIFERRSAPHGLTYGARLMMLWLATLSNIALGSYTTLKTSVLYTAYEAHERLYALPALSDEQIGGIIIWIPSSMMCLVAILIVIHWWGRKETRAEEGRPAAAAVKIRPTTAAELIAQSRAKNRTLAAAMTAFALMVFASIFLIGVLSTLPAFKNNGSASQAATSLGATGKHALSAAPTGRRRHSGHAH